MLSKRATMCGLCTYAVEMYSKWMNEVEKKSSRQKDAANWNVIWNLYFYQNTPIVLCMRFKQQLFWRYFSLSFSFSRWVVFFLVLMELVLFVLPQASCIHFPFIQINEWRGNILLCFFVSAPTLEIVLLPGSFFSTLNFIMKLYCRTSRHSHANRINYRWEKNRLAWRFTEAFKGHNFRKNESSRHSITFVKLKISNKFRIINEKRKEKKEAFAHFQFHSWLFLFVPMDDTPLLY